MNHLYHSVWNEALGAWKIVIEQGKCSSNRRKVLATGLLFCTTPAGALPTGEQLVAGQATVSTFNANVMQIDQTSQKAVINWQGFSVQQHETVNIQQPNANAALLNRVVGQDASQIQGQINANGQVYLVNPNGVVFGKTAQVDVGGLVATTHNIKDADFMNGKQHFTQDGATGSVENYGTIKTPEGGVVALIGERVSNTGTINTPKGTTSLAAGKTVDLDFKGNGLIEVNVSEAVLNAQIVNKGAIQADGGRVILTAKAAGQLIDTVINQAGIIRAQGLVERNGEIMLDGGNSGITQVRGTLNTAGQQTGGKISVMGEQVQINNGAILSASGNTGGGVIIIGDKQNTNQTTIEQGANITAQALDHDNAGTINVLANMNNGTVNIAGQLNAAALKNGDGGFIDTSAAHVKIADSAQISTQAATGKTGTWIIDPTDFTIAASGGDVTGTALSTSLNSTNINVFSTAGSTGSNGDVNVNDAVSWSANQLTLNAQRNININANLNGSGTAKLALQYGQASASGGTNDNYFINNATKVTLPAGVNFSTQKGSTGTVTNYTVMTSLGIEGSTTATDLQGMNGNLAGNYALGADIDATATTAWNNGSGFLPVGNGGTSFTGRFDGLGHTITGLSINSFLGDIGLFGFTDANSTISNLGLVGGSVSGDSFVGELVGFNNGTISNSYATGSVNGAIRIRQNIGGLVGANGGTISNAYATGNISGVINVGGLVGVNIGTISNTYATGSVSGSSSVGGLVGGNSGSISNSYATGSVSSPELVGGLVGSNNGGTITNAFWDTQTTTQSISAGGIGKTSVEMKQLATFNSAGWNISNTSGSSAVWRLYEGSTTPLLRYWLTPLTITDNGLSTVSYSIAGAATSGHLFGTGTGVYSDQQGYDISLANSVVIIPPPTITPPTIIPVEPTTVIPVEPTVVIPAEPTTIIPVESTAVIPTEPIVVIPVEPVAPVIQVNLVDSELWLSQISPLQQSTIFLPWDHEKLASDDENTLDVEEKGINLPTIVLDAPFNMSCQPSQASVGTGTHVWTQTIPSSRTAFLNLSTLFSWTVGD